MMDGSGVFFGGGFMWIFWILVLAVVIFAIKGFAGNNSGSMDRLPESPLEILEKRYARGEIDEDEYERRRNNIHDR